MGRNKIRELNLKAILKFFIPVILIILIVGWASYRFVHPIPPKTLVMSTGMEQGSFVLFGERYRQMLARNGIQVKLLPSSGAVENLKRLKDQSQRVDAGFVQEMLHGKDIRLMSFNQAESYTRLFPRLSHVILPKGIVNLSERYPSSDVHLLASTVNLIVRKTLHPALIYLLLKTSREMFSGADWIHKAGEFPSLKTQDFPISEQAQRFYKSGGSVLYDSLPFWAAAFINSMLLILIPLGVILIPMIGILPWLYTWRNRSKYYRWYRELRNFEKDMTEYYRLENFNDYQERLGQIEKAVDRIKISVPFYDEVFILKGHIQMVRQKLIDLNRPLSRSSDTTKADPAKID